MQPFSPNNFFDLSTFRYASLFENKHYVWDVLSALKNYLSEYQLGKIEGDISHQAYLINPELISVGSNTVVEPGAYIKGPCVIGNNCTVRHGAYIRGNVLVGDECVIGHDTEMKGSIMLNKAHAAHFAYVGDSILGNGVNLGAGTVLANLRLDRKEVVIKLNDQVFKTGLKKFGAILGDGAQTGCNAVLNPGTFLKKGMTCLPCERVSGFR